MKRNKIHSKKALQIRMVIAVLVCVAAAAVLTFYPKDQEEKVQTEQEEPTTPPVRSTGQAQLVPAPVENPDEEVYSFLQGPKSWKKRLPWSGKWGVTHMDGSSFGAFGCGLCCVANLYSTLTPYKASPVDAYEWAKDSTKYGGGCAISWTQIGHTLKRSGLPAELWNKPKNYPMFQDQVKEAAGCIVLVCSYNDDSYWKNTPGHYVTIFHYNEEDDTVFLCDSGDPGHNRSRIKLRTIYKALKTESDHQYLTVGAYDENGDQWKNTKLSGKFVLEEAYQ